MLSQNKQSFFKHAFLSKKVFIKEKYRKQYENKFVTEE